MSELVEGNRIIHFNSPAETAKSAEPIHTEDEISPPATPFPVDCLPDLPLRMLREVSRGAQVPEALVASCILGFLSASIGAGLEIMSGGDRRTRANLFILPVAESGTGKGQAFKIVAAPFLESEHRMIEEWRNSVLPNSLAEKAAAESQITKLKKSVPKNQGEHREGLMNELRDAQKCLIEQEVSLVPPCLCIGDTTKEAVSLALSEQPGEALASLSAEARGVVDVLAGRYGNGKTDEDVYCSAFSGDFCKVRRIGRPPVLLKAPCLTIVWLIQPDALQKILNNPCLTESGLLPRFLFCNTRAEPQEMPEEPHRMDAGVVAGWKTLIQCLLESYRQNGASPSVIECTRGAAGIIRHFNNEVVRRRQPGGDLRDVTIYAARWAEIAWRLSLVLHAAEHGADARDQHLSELTATRAVTIVKWFAQEQLAILKQARVDRRMERVGKVREILSDCPNRRLPIRDLERRHNFKRDELEELAAAFPHLLTIQIEKPLGPGRPSQVVCVPSC